MWKKKKTPKLNKTKWFTSATSSSGNNSTGQDRQYGNAKDDTSPDDTSKHYSGQWFASLTADVSGLVGSSKKHDEVNAKTKTSEKNTHTSEIDKPKVGSGHKGHIITTATKEKLVLKTLSENPKKSDAAYKGTKIDQNDSKSVKVKGTYPIDKEVEVTSEIKNLGKDMKKGLDFDFAHFEKDMNKEIEDGNIEPVGSFGEKAVSADFDSAYFNMENGNTKEPMHEFDDHLEFEQTTEPDSLAYRNIYSNPKRSEEKYWNDWEKFSAISGMSIEELVREAETGYLILDERSFPRVQKRFLSMPKVIKRQYYKCGDSYVIPEQIPTWSEDCIKLGLEAKEDSDHDIGDETLNQKVSLIHNDITTLELDAVVNSISSHVTDTHTGVSRAITTAASRLVRYELDSIMIIYIGEVEVTAGYILPAKYIFHTSGPTGYQDRLQSCYINCLEKMKHMGLRTLAFPCISTGAKGIAANQAATIALSTVKEWLKDNKDSVDKIVFCVYDIDNWACYQKLMPQVFPPGPKKNNSISGVSLIPAEILRMDEHSIELYKQALSEGKEAVHNIRVMVVGHYGVGKTTLTKRLFGEDVDIIKRESTDGIDVHVRRCNVSLDTGQWNIVSKVNKKETVSHRLIKFLQTPEIADQTSKDANKEKDTTKHDHQTVDGQILASDDNNASVIKDDGSVAPMDAGGPDTKDENPETTCKTPWMAEDNEDKPKENYDMENPNPQASYILSHLRAFIDDIKQQSIDMDESNSATLSLWDFAGQSVFYATHQVFLSRRAVYLLVTDISKHVQDLVEDDDIYIDGRGANNWKISEFVDFWLNSIHEFCNSPSEDGPPVILIGTFADKLDQATKATRVDDFFYTLRSLLVDKVTSSHLIDEDFALDNSIIDSSLEQLRKKLLETAAKQSYWGELIPAKWITLENIIISLKDKEIKVLSKDKLHNLNNTLPVPIETDDEIELFLRFHHESGNLLYFSDEEKLKNSIVLDPQWLIDAFKSLITARMFCCKKPNILKKWLQFDQSAILTRELADVIWEKDGDGQFYQHKELILDYLEKLGIIAKPLQHLESHEVIDYYFAPCVLKTPPPENELKCYDSTMRKSTSKLCFKTTSGFLPTAVFNKLLAACISKWPLSRKQGKPMIYCGCGVFDLHSNHIVHLYFVNHVIQIWLTRLSTHGAEPDSQVCSNVRDFVTNLLRTKFTMSSGIKILVQCPKSDLCNDENFFEMTHLADEAEVICSCGRDGQHVLRGKDLTKYWICSGTKPADDSHIPTDREISRIAHHIGREYQSLGLELGLTQAEIDHINLDHKTTVDRITAILMRWKGKEASTATVDNLRKAMEQAGADAETALQNVKKLI